LFKELEQGSAIYWKGKKFKIKFIKQRNANKKEALKEYNKKYYHKHRKEYPVEEVTNV